jgi:hypothetical protein
MNTPQNKKEPPVRLVPFFVDFMKYAIGFAIIVAAALFTLHMAAAAMP